MPRDSRLYTAFPNDEWLGPSRADSGPEQYTYLISWKTNTDRPIIKVGITCRPERWRSFVSLGATIHVILRAPIWLSSEVESDTHELLDRISARSFKTKEESLPYLGSNGGWTECYDAEPILGMRAMKVVLDALVQD